MSGVLASWAVLDAGERKARCRALAALAHVFAGRVADDLVVAAERAEGDIAWLSDADVALGRLPAIPLRRTLSVLARFCS
jgi:hypothetical protein